MAYDRARLEAQLRLDEGRRDRPYRDSRGIWTAGIGHNLEAHGIDPASLPTPIPDATIEQWFQEDIAATEASLDRNFNGWRSFGDDRQLAVMNLCFNMGWGNGAHGLSTFRNMLAAMLAGDWGGAADDLLASAYAEEVGDRATRVALLMTGEAA